VHTFCLDVGIAEFMPIKRESFVFHHGTLDAPPMMRRLSVNGDETRDFLSQLAHLSLKSSNGAQMYIVHGVESKRAGHGEDDFPGLDWHFEYLVEDKRKPDGAKVGHGEKILTPLRFSCSPGLVHPKQARKVTVMQVWKKSVQPRLLAHKVESPRAPFTSSSDGPSSPLQSFSHKGVKRFSSGHKMAIWGISGSQRAESTYGLLQDDNSWEDIHDESMDERSMMRGSLSHRRSITSARDGFQVLQSSPPSMVLGRSRSMDSRIVSDASDTSSMIHPRQIATGEELGHMLVDGKQRPPGAERRMSHGGFQRNNTDGYHPLDHPSYHHRHER
jgi:hypothetical protein